MVNFTTILIIILSIFGIGLFLSNFLKKTEDTLNNIISEINKPADLSKSTDLSKTSKSSTTETDLSKSTTDLSKSSTTETDLSKSSTTETDLSKSTTDLSKSSTTETDLSKTDLTGQTKKSYALQTIDEITNQEIDDIRNIIIPSIQTTIRQSLDKLKDQKAKDDLQKRIDEINKMLDAKTDIDQIKNVLIPSLKTSIDALKLQVTTDEIKVQESKVKERIYEYVEEEEEIPELEYKNRKYTIISDYLLFD